MSNEELFYAYVENVIAEDNSINTIITIKVDDLPECNIVNNDTITTPVVLTSEDLIELEMTIKKNFIIEILSTLSLQNSIDNVIEIYNNSIIDYNTKNRLCVSNINNENSIKLYFIKIYYSINSVLAKYNIRNINMFETLNVRDVGINHKTYYITLGVRS